MKTPDQKEFQHCVAFGIDDDHRMPPFAKNAKPSPQNTQALDDWLTSILAYHPLTSDRPWLFYEEIDRFLGPWGRDGYPITYGKRYCELFYGNRSLNRTALREVFEEFDEQTCSWRP